MKYEILYRGKEFFSVPGHDSFRASNYLSGYYWFPVRCILLLYTRVYNKYICEYLYDRKRCRRCLHCPAVTAHRVWAICIIAICPLTSANGVRLHKSFSFLVNCYRFYRRPESKFMAAPRDAPEKVAAERRSANRFSQIYSYINF